MSSNETTVPPFVAGPVGTTTKQTIAYSWSASTLPGNVGQSEGFVFAPKTNLLVRTGLIESGVQTTYGNLFPINLSGTVTTDSSFVVTCGRDVMLPFPDSEAPNSRGGSFGFINFGLLVDYELTYKVLAFSATSTNSAATNFGSLTACWLSQIPAQDFHQLALANSQLWQNGVCNADPIAGIVFKTPGYLGGYHDFSMHYCSPGRHHFIHSTPFVNSFGLFFSPYGFTPGSGSSFGYSIHTSDIEFPWGVIPTLVLEVQPGNNATATNYCIAAMHLFAYASSSGAFEVTSVVRTSPAFSTMNMTPTGADQPTFEWETTPVDVDGNNYLGNAMYIGSYFSVYSPNSTLGNIPNLRLSVYTSTDARERLTDLFVARLTKPSPGMQIGLSGPITIKFPPVGKIAAIVAGQPPAAIADAASTVDQMQLTTKERVAVELLAVPTYPQFEKIPLGSKRSRHA